MAALPAPGESPDNPAFPEGGGQPHPPAAGSGTPASDRGHPPDLWLLGGRPDAVQGLRPSRAVPARTPLPPAAGLTAARGQGRRAIARIIGQARGGLPATARQSVAFDNGFEFARRYRRHGRGIATYFCDTHAPWQKGEVENALGRRRTGVPICQICRTTCSSNGCGLIIKIPGRI